MSSCQKRKIDHSLDELQPPSKKQRENPHIPTKKESKTVFEDVDDQKQYFEIYNVLTQTKLILNINAPLTISQLISEYATGKISKCFYCGEIVWYLNGDTFENDIFKIKQGLVCKPCREKQLDCHFCGIVFPLFGTHLCGNCKSPICPNIVDCGNNNECKCAFANRICKSCVVKCYCCQSVLCALCSIKCEDCCYSRCDDANCAAECDICEEEICIECKYEITCIMCDGCQCEDCLDHCKCCDAVCCADCLINGSCMKCNEEETNGGDDVNDGDSDNDNDGYGFSDMYGQE